MKYVILKPAKPLDPRRLVNLKSVDELDKWFEHIGTSDQEAAIVPLVRQLLPDSVPMPVPIKIGPVREGAGEVFLLGFVEDSSVAVDPNGDIPFVLFVHARGEGGGDTFQLKKLGHRIYDRTLWRLPPIRPELARVYDVEARVTDLEVPLFTELRVGTHNGRLVLWADLLGKQISFTFDDEVMFVDGGKASEAPG